jgi:hypothetical protein
VEQDVKTNSSSTKFVVYSRPKLATLENKKIDRKTEVDIDIRITQCVRKLETAFCEFSKQAARLARLAQQKEKCSIPSDAFNHLLSEGISKVELTFDAYIRRNKELFTNIKAISQRSRFYDRQKSSQSTSSIAELELMLGEFSASDRHHLQIERSSSPVGVLG